MVGVRRFALLVIAAGCGSVRSSNTAIDGSTNVDGSAGNDDAGTACGHRGQACCAGVCELRASCDGTACIAADVWSSSADGTFNFDGGSWVHPILSGTTSQLPGVNGLWGTTSTFVVGVGTNALILRYDGTSWHKDVAARTDGTGTLYGVAGSSATDVWAVGDAHFTHYTGGWVDVTPPTTSDPFLAVWLSAPGEGWACGQSGVLAQLHNNTWMFVNRRGSSYARNGLWGSGPKDIWMVGSRHSLVTGTPLSIEHYDGSSWNDVSDTLDPQGSLPPLNALWGSDATHVWAVGENGTIVFWNGTLWKSLLSGTTDSLSAVWGSGPNDVWVAGAGGVRHFNGTTWSAIPGLSSRPVAVWLSQQ